MAIKCYITDLFRRGNIDRVLEETCERASEENRKKGNHGGNIDRVLEETRERLKKKLLQHSGLKLFRLA